jgi:hypothetical protein
MTTAVKLEDGAKSCLEELQAEIKLRTGRKVTQQELLTRIVEDAYESKSELIDSFRETTVPLPEEERETFHSGIFSSGRETDEEDIDEILYG